MDSQRDIPANIQQTAPCPAPLLDAVRTMTRSLREHLDSASLPTQERARVAKAAWLLQELITILTGSTGNPIILLPIITSARLLKRCGSDEKAAQQYAREAVAWALRMNIAACDFGIGTDEPAESIRDQDPD